MAKIIIALLTKKYLRKTKENHSYYLLHLSPCRSLTKLYFQLTGQKSPLLKTNSQLFYLFLESNKWGNKLKVANTYLFQYQKRNNYLHLEDWKILGDQLTIKRVLKLVINNVI